VVQVALVEPLVHAIMPTDLRELLDERDRRYESRFAAQERAADAALAAQKELTSAAFASAEKAILKAEEAQRAYNERSNEFRDALDDQNKRMLPRTEAEAQLAALDNKIADTAADVASLRESRSSIEGSRDQTMYLMGIMLAVFFAAVQVAVNVYNRRSSAK